MACGTLNGENERVQGDQVADGGIEEVLRLFRLEGGPGSSGGFPARAARPTPPP